MEEKEIQDELASIRSIMERSSKFISLSGLSGILAGVYALIGAAFAYHIIYNEGSQTAIRLPATIFQDPQALSLFLVAFVVLIVSIITGIVLSVRKAKRKGQTIWSQTSRALLFQMATPLVSGGILILIFILRGHYSIVASASLIFYGLALIGASNFTFTDVKYLGICEILLGLVAACLPGYGLLFWAFGFGVLHIFYGIVMYFKYDR